MSKRFNPAWNGHYDFDDPANQAEIVKIDSYDPELDTNCYALGGGDVIPSPWGENQTLDAGIYSKGFIYNIEASFLLNAEFLQRLSKYPMGFCKKKLVVLPGKMLSLQRHMARQEYWMVSSGLLTVILDGKKYEVMAGESLFIPQGAVHCMSNTKMVPVEVIELQTGITREKDNVRLMDFSGRPTYPITTEIEYLSAIIYADIQREIAEKFKTGNHPHSSFFVQKEL